MRTILLLIAVILMTMGTGSAFANPPASPTTMPVDRAAVACENFLGFGVEWDPGFWREWNTKLGVTEADWDLMVKRIEWMRIPLVRMMMQVKWCRDDKGNFDFDRPEMKNVYRYLDVCQKQGIAVILTDWGCEPNWLRLADIANVGDPKYAAGIGTYVEHLLNQKKYTCIKYFVMVNEPNFEVKDFARWKLGVEQVTAEFKKRGLDKKLVFLGSDESNNEQWHHQAVDQLQDVLGGYDIHRYAQANDVRSGGLQQFWRTQWQYAWTKDPKSKGKPMIVGEAGLFSPGFGAGNNPRHLEYGYGVDMADYAAQAVAAGSSAVSAWMLDDSSHANFNWGMWKDKRGQFALKPWFYTWSLLCRTVPASSKTYAVKQGTDLRVLAASHGTGNAETWTFCIVNRGKEPTRVELRVPDLKPTTFKHYLYSEAKAAVDKDGFPMPVEEKSGDLNSGITVICPGNAAYFLTSTK